MNLAKLNDFPSLLHFFGMNTSTKAPYCWKVYIIYPTNILLENIGEITRGDVIVSVSFVIRLSLPPSLIIDTYIEYASRIYVRN